MSGQLPGKAVKPGQVLMSPGTRVDAADQSAMNPFSLSTGSELRSLAWVPSGATLTRSVVPASRSLTNASGQVPGL